VHIVDGAGVVRSAMVQRFAGQHGWVDVRPLEIRDGMVIVSERGEQ
jgi:hypothetical protein